MRRHDLGSVTVEPPPAAGPAPDPAAGPAGTRRESSVPAVRPAARRRLGGIGRHRLITLLLALAAVLRVVTMLGHRPAFLYYGDSYSYLRLGTSPEPLWGFQPSGYGMFLWLLSPLHSLVLVTAVQHILGLCTGLLVYALLRRHGLPAWGATLAAVPVLFDGRALVIEHAILSDTLFIFLTVAVVTVLSWSARLSAVAAASAGLLLALAALTRTIALPLLVLALVAVAVRRVGLRPLLAMTVAGGLPIILYAAWYAGVHGRFTLAGGDGVALWARTMTFADCQVIRPPASEAWLCPNGSHQDAASEYVWADDSAINRPPDRRRESDPRPERWDNERARSFAFRAITAQPLDYVGAVARDVSLAFHWTPAPHPRRVAGAYRFSEGRSHPPADKPTAIASLRAYDPSVHGWHSVSPYAGFLVSYQEIAQLRGPVLGGVLLLGVLGIRRRTWGATVPWGAAMALLVLPVAALDFDHRYVLPVTPVACVAAALGVASRGRGRRATNMIAANLAATNLPGGLRGGRSPRR